MAGLVRDASIGQMLEPDQLVLCEHDREPEECPICGRVETEELSFDPQAWVAAYVASSRRPFEVPPELSGVPFG